METSSAIKKELKEKVDIQVVDVASAPYERVLGEKVGKGLQSFHESNGLTFNLGVGLKAINGENNRATSVVLSNGKELKADLILLGTGIQPNLGFVQDLQISPNGGLQTDMYLKTSNPNIYAAGDIASYPYFYTGERIRVEHYNEAF